MRIKKIYYLILIATLSVPTLVSAAMSSTNYYIFADTVSVGGGLSTSTNFNMQDTIGGISGISTSTSYEVKAGYQAQDNGILSLSLSSNSIDFLSLSTIGQLSTSNIIATVSASNGYSLSISSVSGTALPAVADGLVDGSNSLGEYGLAVTGTPAAYINDAAVINGLSLASNPLPAVSDTTTLIFKVVRGSASVAGDYSQNITLTASANP